MGGVSVQRLYYEIRLSRLETKLGFSIPKNIFGYGLVIPHAGTIVIGGGNKIGNYCVLHTSTCITEGKKIIGDALYLSAGAKIVHDIELKDGISIGANSLVNSSFEESNAVIAGAPAKYIKSSEPWYIRDGKEFSKRREIIEELKEKMGI